jgi:hypothetical protein
VDVEPVIGDVNGDGKLNLSDITTVLKSIVGGAPFQNLKEAMQADISPLPGTEGRFYGDGKVDLGDVIALIRRAVGLDTGPLVAPPVSAQSLFLPSDQEGTGVEATSRSPRVPIKPWRGGKWIE